MKTPNCWLEQVKHGITARRLLVKIRVDVNGLRGAIPPQNFFGILKCQDTEIKNSKMRAPRVFREV